MCCSSAEAVIAGGLQDRTSYQVPPFTVLLFVRAISERYMASRVVPQVVFLPEISHRHLSTNNAIG